jgi:tetratricopeptide (TPR) repeat protein
MSHVGATRYGAVGAWVSAVLVGGSLLLTPMPKGTAHAAEALQVTPSDEADADPITTHLERGQAYLDKGEYAKAVLEFEQVLRFDNLPPDLRQQAEIYAQAAQRYARGERLSAFGFAVTVGGL